MAYEIIDNFIPADEYEILKGIMMDEETTSWFYKSTQVGGKPDHFFFYHVLYTAQRPNSPLWDAVEQMFIAHLKPNALINVRANLVVNTNGVGFNSPHRDTYTPELDHKVAVFYFGENNGKTVLCLEDGEVEIDSKDNRLLKFSADTLHYVKHQTDTDRRIVINTNYY